MNTHDQKIYEFTSKLIRDTQAKLYRQLRNRAAKVDNPQQFLTTALTEAKIQLEMHRRKPFTPQPHDTGDNDPPEAA